MGVSNLWIATRFKLFWENAAFFRYSGVNAANAANFLAKRR